mgnify:CR=1 FL=1
MRRVRRRKQDSTMFRRILLVLLLVPFSIAGFAAQLTATLQSGDKVTPFYGNNAFADAYSASADGEIITLSPGSFNNVPEIAKSITVIGSYAFSEDTSKATLVNGDITVTADNVALEGLRFINTLKIKATNNLNVSRCYISLTEDLENGENKYHGNSTFTDCMIPQYKAMSFSKNTVLRNCCINYFEDCNESANPALIENCNIPLFACYDYGYYYCQPYAIYRNCFLGLFAWSSSSGSTPTLHVYSPSEFHNNLFYENYYSSPGYANMKAWTIIFGSCIEDGNNYNYAYEIKSRDKVLRYSSLIPYKYLGTSYGPADHKEYPAVPAVTKAEIDTQTDAEGKLHVKIEAAARD